MAWNEINEDAATWDNATLYFAVGMMFTPTGKATKARIKVDKFNATLSWRVIDLSGSIQQTLLDGLTNVTNFTGFLEVDISSANLEPGKPYLFAWRRNLGSGSFASNYSGEGTAMGTNNSQWSAFSPINREFYLGIYEEPTGPTLKRYVDGEWVPATVKRFDNGQWVEATTITKT